MRLRDEVIVGSRLAFALQMQYTQSRYDYFSPCEINSLIKVGFRL